ncbi:MAG: hypothetical protein NT166_22205 [Candidatus Aminicenantes bacterium]|nr:hypothetical protein [Candidatus Aminicenantes bacterium]
MTQNNEKINIYNELKNIILSSDRDKLLPSLKDAFRNADVEKRGEYKLELLKLALEPEIEPFHGTIFETLASLNSIWAEYIPRKDLIRKYNIFYDEGEYKEAARVCSNLIAQGLDFIDTIDAGKGSLLPIYDEQEPKILQFNENSIRLLDLDLNMIHQVDVPQDQQIIDVLTPTNYPEFHPGSSGNETGYMGIIRVLMKDKNTLQRWIIPLANDRKSLDPGAKIEVPGKYANFNRLSYFQGHLLLVGDQSILYHRSGQGWEPWLTTEGKITCFKEIEGYYWIGIADGHVRIIQDFEKKGVRKSLERFSTFITSISSHGKYAAAAGKNEWTITTLEGTSIIEPIKNNSPIHQIVILNDDVLAILQDNSRLMGHDIRDGSVLWQINLDDRYDSLFKLGNRIYCKKEVGTVKLFILPDTPKMIHELKMHNITVTEGALPKDPTAPVRDWIDFYGRNRVLEEIIKSPQTHFFITGAPKSGKTSLLYILNDFLSATSRCCYIDMEQMNQESSSYNALAEKFYKACLSQHGIPREGRIELSGFQWLREIIKKVRGRKDHCVFCLDNFVPPKFTDALDTEKFNQLFKEMNVLQNVRLIVTYSKNNQKENDRYFKEINPIAGRRSIQNIDLQPFFEEEAKNAISMIGTLSKQQVEEVYNYTGGFPHLIRLYQEWDPQESNIETCSDRISLKHKEIIFAYFKGLSPNACLILATLLYKDLVSKKVFLKKLYDDYPLLAEFVKPEQFKDILEEFKNYSSALKVEYDEVSFSVEIQGKPRLFYLASRYIPWINELFALYQFSVKPSLENAHEIIKVYRDLLGIKIEDEENANDLLFNELRDKYNSQFYIRRMSPEARIALKIPLVTFVVIPLNPWIKGKTGQFFSSLHGSLQEYIRRLKKINEREGAAAARFYIMLFSFMGTSSKGLKEDMSGLERVSIIDSQEMNEVLLAGSPQEKTREILFQQLRISERSPYISSGPVEDLFYGRDIEIALVRGLPENIGIFGTRTIGKTSLMLKLYRDLKGLENWRVFALDCGRIDSEEKFLSTLAEKMDIPFREIADIEKFKKIITREAENKKVKYLFLLDEVDQLIAYDVKHSEKIFRTFNILCSEPLKSSKDTAARFVLLGFEEMFNQMKNPRSRLYNFMVFLPLNSLDINRALELVTRPMENIFVNWQNKEEDAYYLVNQCSGHPWLLQNACHILLKILEQKSEKLAIIERKNVDQALFHDDFRKLCLRPYESIILLDKKEFIPGIYKITTLAALLFHLEKRKEFFSLNDIRNELKCYGVNMPPDQMHAVITRLCMHGIFRYVDDPDIIMKDDKSREEQVRQGIQEAREKIDDKVWEIIGEKVGEIKLKESDIFDVRKEHFLEFKYQFAVKIFPRLLTVTRGGLENCRTEIMDTIKKKK